MRSLRTQAYFLYPFPHSCSDDLLETGPVPQDSAWKHWFARSADTVDHVSLVIDHSFSFLPHVRRILFPELVGLTSDASKQVLQSLNIFDVSSVRAHISRTQLSDAHDQFRHTGTRLTWTGRQLAPGTAVTIRTPERGGSDYKCTLRWIDAMLFPIGVGVLIVALELPPNLPTAAIAKLLRYAKKVEYRRRLSIEVAQLSLEEAGFPPNGGRGSTWLDILPTLLRDLAVASPLDPEFNVSEVTGTLGVNWRLAVISNIESEEREISAPFKSSLEIATFALATGREPTSRADSGCPSDKGWGNLSETRCLSLWQDWLMLYHYDNLVDVVESEDVVYRANQFEIFEHEYLTLFFLAMAQRHLLDLLESDLAQVAGPPEVTDAKLRRFDDAVTRFITRLWQRNVSTTPVGDPLYVMLRSGLGLAESFDAIRNSSAALRSHLQLRESRRLAASSARAQRLVELVAIVAAPLGAATVVMQTRLADFAWIARLTPKEAWLILCGILVLTILIYVAVRSVRARSDDEF